MYAKSFTLCARFVEPIFVVALLSIPAHAQEVQWVSVKSGPVAVLLDPKPASIVVGLVNPGTRLEVREIREGWYMVVLPRDEGEPAARSGWIPAAMVYLVSAPLPPEPPSTSTIPPTAVPTPVSKTAPRGGTAIKPAPPAKVPPPPKQKSAGEPPRRTAPSSSSDTDRFFISANGAQQQGALAFQDSRSESYFAETRSWTADYAAKREAGFDVGGAVRLWRDLNVGVAFSRFEAQNRTAVIGGSIPHPFWFERPRTISGESDALRHSERTVHVSAQWTLPRISRLRLSVFGGPSFVAVRRQLVEDVTFTQTYPYNSATYQTAVIRSVSGSRTGFHSGVDASWFFMRQIGVGLIVRYTSAEVDLKSPATGRDVPIDLGGVQVGGGVRFALRGWR